MSTEATPETGITTSTVSSTNPVKAARPDIIVTNSETTPPEVMSALIFEDLGGIELINIARNDMVNGQNVVYRPIKNLSSLARQYGPQNLIALQGTSDKYFDNFPIKLEKHIPEVGTGPNKETVYIDNTTRDLVVNVMGLADDELVEIQVLSRGTVISDTIY